MKKMWSEQEIDFIKYLYLKRGLSLTELYPIFIQKFDRNKNGISTKIVKLKLKHTKQQIFEIKSRLNSGEKNAMFGKKSWNKGLTKKTDETLKKNYQKISNIVKIQYKNGERNTSGKNNGMYGKLPWNKDLNKQTNIKIESMSQNISKTRKKMFSNYSDEDWLKLKNQLKICRQKCKKKNTKIELKIRDLLTSLNLLFIEQYPIDCFIVDFFVNNNLIIECFGDYWHCNPNRFDDLSKLNNTQIKNLERDKRKIKYFEENEMDYILLWESNINRDINSIQNKILERI